MGYKELLNILFYFFLICVPIFPFKYKIYGVPISIDFLIVVAMVLLVFILIVKKGLNKKNYFNNIMKYFYVFNILFVIISLFSIVYAKNKIAVLSETARFIEYIILFVIIIAYVNKETLMNGYDLFKKSMILTAIVGLIQFIFNLSKYKDGYAILNRGRVYSTFTNPNYYGAAVNLIIFWYIIKTFNEKRNKNNFLINLLIVILFFINLVLTTTRGSWIAFLIGLIIIGLLEYKRILLYIPIIPALMMLVPTIRKRIMSIFIYSKVSDSSSRLKLWETGLYMLKENIFTGVGSGNFIYRYHEYVNKYPSLKIKSNVYTAHNSYIKMLAELGIFGGIIFTVIYFMLAYLTYTVYKNTKDRELKQISLALLAGWGAYLFQNFFNNLMFIPQLNVLVWVLTAMVYKLYLIEGREVNG